MKKQILFAMLLLMGMAVQAQDVQLHYDFGRNIYPDEEAGRQKVTMTLEQFKADKWGSWFYFVDIDFSRKFTEGAYAEISREFNLSTTAVLTASAVSSRLLWWVLLGMATRQISPRPTRYNSCTSATSRVMSTPAVTTVSS